jgi:hypothetical protein
MEELRRQWKRVWQLRPHEKRGAQKFKTTVERAGQIKGVPCQKGNVKAVIDEWKSKGGRQVPYDLVKRIQIQPEAGRLKGRHDEGVQDVADGKTTTHAAEKSTKQKGKQRLSAASKGKGRTSTPLG